MTWIIFWLLLLMKNHGIQSQGWNEMTLMDIINATEQLSEVNKSFYFSRQIEAAACMHLKRKTI